MKRFIHIIVFAAAMLAATSCVEPLNPVLPGQDLTLKFSCGIMTKAETVDGVSNENLIKRIDFYIFPLDDQGKVDEDTEYIFSGEIVPDNGLSTDNTYRKTIGRADLYTIFPEGVNQAMVFAVANYVDSDGNVVTVPSDVTTWKAMHDLEVGATFFKDGGPGYGLRWPRKMDPSDEQLFFVMTGEKIIVKAPSAEDDNVVPLERLASKVTVNFTFNTVTDEKGIKWIPQVSPYFDVDSNTEVELSEQAEAQSEARIFLSNAILHTTLGGPLTRDLIADSGATFSDGTRDIFEYAYDFLKDITITNTAGKKTAHYYTYPISMEEGDDNQPYLKLVLPWYGYKYRGTETNPAFDVNDPNWVPYKQKEVYYKIVIPRASINEGNRIYEYSVTVNIIGNEKEVTIDGDYEVKDWTYDKVISSNVATGRYISLDIPKDEYDMYVNEIDIAFVSSGKVIAYIDEIYQLDMSGSSPTPQYFMQDDEVTATTALLTKKGLSAGQIEEWVTIPEGTSYLKINHAMDNRLMVNNAKNNAFDMVPYVFKVTLHLEDAGDDHTFDRHVTITQYPSMYVTALKSNGVVWVNGYNRSNGQSSGSYYYALNDRTGGGDDGKRIGTITNPANVTGSGTNNSQYHTIVHPTVLDPSLKMGDGSSLILGDARVPNGGTMTYITGVSNYKETRSDLNNIVSPGFMLASSYGKTLTMQFARAEERCASYQESGYPAGRWRIPTEGEIEFLVRLSKYGFIQSLFDGEYWASSGRYYSSDDSQFHAGNSSSQAVRCIYDVWYWGEEPYQENATTWLGFQDN